MNTVRRQDSKVPDTKGGRTDDSPSCADLAASMHDAVTRARLHATLWLIHRGIMEQAVADFEALRSACAPKRLAPQ
jgi:hypothetical protein